MALYKFDYLVRTAKVDRSRAIFKFYALYALVREHWTSPNILETKTKNQKTVIDAVLAVLNDNEKFTSHIEKVAKHLEKVISDSDIVSREKIRDFIRNDRVVEKFTSELLSN